MKRQEIGRFSLVTLADKEYEFIVFDNNLIDCPELYIGNADYMYVKPRLELVVKYLTKNGMKYSTYSIGLKKEDSIKEIKIEDDLFDYMKKNNMIVYSTDMAYLYNFKDKDGFDRSKKSGRPFKWAEKKGPVLTKQKQGQYN